MEAFRLLTAYSSVLSILSRFINAMTARMEVFPGGAFTAIYIFFFVACDGLRQPRSYHLHCCRYGCQVFPPTRFQSP